MKKVIAIEIDDSIDVDHLIDNLIALSEFSDNITDDERKGIRDACKKEKQVVAVKLPKDWEGIDPNHMYHKVTKFTFMSSEITQLEHDLVANLCVAMEKLTDKPINDEV